MHQKNRHRNPHLPKLHVHASGNANYLDLMRIVGDIKPKKLIPIHTEHPKLARARDATIKGHKINNYDFLLPNLDMKIEFKATRHGGKSQLNEIRFGRKGKRIADYYLLIAPKIPNTIDFLKECQDMNYKMVVEEIYGKHQYILALIESPHMSA